MTTPTVHVPIKPLSVNECWQGRRFKTSKYDTYVREFMRKLPDLDISTVGKLVLKIDVGFSSKKSDLDNILKPVIDILQKRYGFDDRRIYQIDACKEDVPKGQEYVTFKIHCL